MFGAVEQIAEQGRATGGYGPPMPVSADAPAFGRALGAGGRNPAWDA
ncbi:hypothetical protein [Streptomyces montanus]|nr:hypothetical protein [Streptomyces montanus]